MKHTSCLIVVMAGACCLPMRGQIAFTGNYGENFDVFGPAGTVLPAGWSAVRYAGSGTLGAELTPGVTTGTTTTGGIYNVGASGDADRALGVLATGTTVPRFGAQFVNSSGITITDLSLAAVMEQWRTGGSDAVNETVTFEYSLDATGVDDAAATWIALSGFDLVEKLTGSTSGGAVDGNHPDNQLAMAAGLSGINWASGDTLTLRWSDADVTGGDGLYALDNFTMVTPVPEPSTFAMLGLGLLSFAAWHLRRRRA